MVVSIPLAILCFTCVCVWSYDAKVGNKCHTFSTTQFGSQKIRYRENDVSSSKASTSLLYIHGFGGNADQFRNNMELSSASNEVKTYALDLLGYGYSDKPSPRAYQPNALYNFYTWSDLVTDFITNVIEEPTVLCCNSIGGIVGLQAAVDRPDLIKGVILVDVSLRCAGYSVFSSLFLFLLLFFSFS